MGGNDPVSDGRYLVNSTEVILVTVNYRLGPLGFLYNNEGGGDMIPGNMGLLDQQYAMKWVQKNIGNFGGNRDKVTIFGVSAGGQSVFHHFLVDTSEPLFNRGIIQSGPAACPDLTTEQAQNLTNNYLQILGCSDATCLKDATPEELFLPLQTLTKQFITTNDPWSVVEPFRFVIDGTLVNGQPIELFRDGRWHTHKEVILGSNLNEWAWVDAIFSNQKMPKEIFERLTLLTAGEELAPSVGAFYETMFLQEEDDDYTIAFSNEMKDAFISCPVRLLARFLSATSTSSLPSPYLYVDEHPVSEPVCNQIKPPFYQPCGYAYHGSEKAFEFKTGPSMGYDFSDNDYIASEIFSQYWTSFAKEGKPSSPEFTEWTPYSLQEDNHIRIKAPNSEMGKEYLRQVCDFWDSTGFLIDSTEIPATSTSTGFEVTTVTEVTTSSATKINYFSFTFILSSFLFAFSFSSI